MNIYVGNLAHAVTEDELRDAFAAYGDVSTVTLIKDKFTGEPRGFAFVEAATSGMKGWVNNAQLLWRLPGTPTTTAPAPAEPQPAEPEPAEREAPAAEEPQAPAAPEATATAVQPPPASTPVPAAPPRPKETPRGAAPSIFDAY